MSTNASADGGFGGADAAPEPPEQEPEPEPAAEPSGEAAPGAVEAEPGGDRPWYAGLDEESRRYVEGKGFGDVGQLISAQRESERELHRRGQVISDYERHLAEPDGAPSEPADGLQSAIDEVNDYAGRIGQAVSAGEMSPAQGFQYLGGIMANALSDMRAELVSDLERTVSERTQPLYNDTWNNHWREEARAIRSEDPEGYQRHAPRARELLGEMLSEEPGLRYNRRAMRMAFAMAGQEAGARERRERGARTLQGGARGRGAQQVDPAKAIIEEMDAVMPASSSGGF